MTRVPPVTSATFPVRSNRSIGRLSRIEDRHDPRRGGAGAREPEREAGDREAARRELPKAEQALDLRVAQAELMSLPEDAGALLAQSVLRLHPQRPVPAPGVDPH